MTSPDQTTDDAKRGTSFDWPLAYEAESLLRKIVEEFLQRNSFARELSERMRVETGTDFFEWIDHLVLDPQYKASLKSSGFQADPVCDAANEEMVVSIPRATLPPVILSEEKQFKIILRPEFVADFATAHNLGNEPEGEPFSRYRRLLVSREAGTVLEAVERHAYRGFTPAHLSATELQAIVKARELWRTRPRRFGEAGEGFKVANETLSRVVALVGRDRACQYFFENERAYWQARNRAARVQKERQDRLGLGWGNHDHHTFRASRLHFVDLIQFLVELGLEKRERFYAGAEAGWGAQVLEHTTTGIVVFADVDLMPEETELDFSSSRLTAPSRLGTVGLWVGLHGESFLDAGMHHLEARFDFDLLRTQLHREGVSTMKPFSDFPFLRQAFTEGERWTVGAERLQALRTAGLITPEQMERFANEGALGSHLENLQRRGGFKGFNQKSVSAIIAATDPRKNQFAKQAAA